MDIFNKREFGAHIAPINRRFKVAPRVSVIGYMSAKRYHVKRTFNSYNYSFILKGEGSYKYRGQVYPVKAPCVITQQPGEPMDYGPYDTWEELFLIYEGGEIDLLKERGLISDSVLMWPITEPAQLYTHLNTLVGLMSISYLDPYIDKVDTLCELLVLESMLGTQPSANSEDMRAIHDIKTYINTHLYDDIHIEQLARAYHLHPATFRRRWMQQIKIPPARFIMEQRIKEACRLLVETTMTVGEIALFLRFEDPLYFSRRFRQLMKITATEYRRRYQYTLSVLYLPDGLPDRFTIVEQ